MGPDQAPRRKFREGSNEWTNVLTRGMSPWTEGSTINSPWSAVLAILRVQAASAMSTALTIIRVLKWLSTLALIVTAAIGAALLDRRFTMLMLPPFFMHAAASRALADGQPADLG